MIASGSFHPLRRHPPIGPDLLTDRTVSPWRRLPRPGIQATRQAHAAQFIDAADLGRRIGAEARVRQN